MIDNNYISIKKGESGFSVAEHHWKAREEFTLSVIAWTTHQLKT